MVRILVSLFLLIGTPAFAEDVAPEPAPELAVEEVYVPPAEASEGIGGWAVVDPVTGNVHGVVVCDIQNCGPEGTFKGVLPGEYMGCTNCNLRFQTKAMADGNVVGYHGTETHVDANGNATQTTNNSVKYNKSDKTFSLNQSTTSGSSTLTTKRKLVPSLTSLDGVNVGTGIISSEEKFETKSNENSASVEYTQNMQDNNFNNIKVKISNLKDSVYQYESRQSAVENLEADVDTTIESQGIQDSIVISTIKELTNTIKEYIQGILRW